MKVSPSFSLHFIDEKCSLSNFLAYNNFLIDGNKFKALNSQGWFFCFLTVLKNRTFRLIEQNETASQILLTNEQLQ